MSAVVPAGRNQTATEEMSAVENETCEEEEEEEEAASGGVKHSRRRLLKMGGCIPFMEISMEPGARSLRNIDSGRFKDEIKRWAKAVVTYARQVSTRFGSSRHSSRSTTFDSQTKDDTAMV